MRGSSLRLFAVTLIALLVVAPEVSHADDGYFDVWLVDTGTSDALLFAGPCGEIGLLDVGEGGSPDVLAFVDRWYDRDDIIWMAVSNYLPEHLDGVEATARASGVAPKKVVDRGGARTAFDSEAYRNYYDWVTATGLREVVRIGTEWSLCAGEVTFRVISQGTDGTAVGGRAVTHEADRGLCLHVEYRAFDMVSCGDIGGTDEGDRTDVETPAADRIGSVEVVKVNGHGASTSSNAHYVDVLDPATALISVGSDDPELPDADVVGRWEASGAGVFPTASHGDIWIITDGESFLDVSTELTAQRFGLHEQPSSEPPPTVTCESSPDPDLAAYSAVFRESTWHIRDRPGGGPADFSFAYGKTTDIPVMGDWNGDGISTPGVFRDGYWHLQNRNCGGAADISFKYGVATDLPIVGDWNGDGRDTVGIIRDREWHLRNDLRAGPGQVVFIYGRITAGDLPLAGDWNGDGVDTPGIVRRGEWHLRNEVWGGPADIAYVYGRVMSGDIPLVGDWNGDRIHTPAIVREATWYLKNEHGGGDADITYRYGTLEDTFLVKPRTNAR